MKMGRDDRSAKWVDGQGVIGSTCHAHHLRANNHAFSIDREIEIDDRMAIESVNVRQHIAAKVTVWIGEILIDDEVKVIAGFLVNVNV